MPHLRIDPADATPIWSQIEEGLRRLVASGALAPGAAVPSVRDLARDLRINPATVAKAYQRLTEAGVLTVRRGDGTYVADSTAGDEQGERHGSSARPPFASRAWPPRSALPRRKRPRP